MMNLETLVFLFVTTTFLVPCFIVGEGNRDEKQNVNWRKWQWYLKDTDVSMNVEEAWRAGYTGKGILVAVVDDGVTNHPDIKPKINLTASYDFLEGRNISLRHNPGSHGTSCAGVIAGGDNAICGVGAAFDAQISSIRIFGDNKRSTDESQANALSFERNMIDVYSNSWGPGDLGFEVEGPGPKLKRELENGTRLGRHGKGSIFVFAAGNGGAIGDSCAFSGYVNSIYTIAISGVNWDGSVPTYTEQCAGVMAVTYGQDTFTDGVVKPPLITAKGANDCTERFPGTSATAAMASGIIALALQANPSLTWRDVQHLIARSSKPLNPPNSKRHWRASRTRPSWTQNGARLLVSSHFGFGLMDASKMIKYGQKWQTVPQQLSCEVKLNISNISSSQLHIPSRGELRLLLSLSQENCDVRYLEHVQAEVNIYSTRRGYLEMFSISPSKTTSKLIYSRTMDIWMGSQNYTNWRVTSLHYWGEKPIGDWNIIIRNARQPGSNIRGRVFDMKLTFYGTKEDPLENNTHVSRGLKQVETVNALRRSEDILIHGRYSKWSPWSSCDRTCGFGFKQRYRFCDNPRPKYGGRNCNRFGPEKELRRCYLRACPVHGRYSKWSPWSSCNSTCGHGSQQRYRFCDNPRPKNGGRNCNGLGPDKESRRCYLHACPVCHDSYYCTLLQVTNCSETLTASWCHKTCGKCKGCPEGWSEFQSSCYFVEKDSKNKTEGAKICRAKGGTLPVIKSLEENTFLLQLTEKYTIDHDLPNLDPWLGMEAPNGDNVFYWDDKTLVTATFSLWNKGEPNHPETEKCAYMYLKYRGKGKWNNNSCRYPRLIVCQKKK